MAPVEMYDMTMRELFNKYEGYMEHQQWMQREAYERMRLQTTALLQVHVKKGKVLKPRDVFRFTWDQEAVEKKPIPKEHAEWMVKKLGLGKLVGSK